MKRALFVIAVVPLAFFVGSEVQAQSVIQPGIAGMTPDRRPEGAPVITETGMTMFGLAVALHGISEPIPKNLDFLDDQGAWFTPFIHPGMTGVYDIRKFHKSGS